MKHKKDRPPKKTQSKAYGNFFIILEQLKNSGIRKKLFSKDMYQLSAEEQSILSAFIGNCGCAVWKEIICRLPDDYYPKSLDPLLKETQVVAKVNIRIRENLKTPLDRNNEDDISSQTFTSKRILQALCETICTAPTDRRYENFLKNLTSYAMRLKKNKGHGNCKKEKLRDFSEYELPATTPSPIEELIEHEEEEISEIIKNTHKEKVRLAVKLLDSWLRKEIEAKKDKVLMASLLSSSQKAPIIQRFSHLRLKHFQKIYQMCRKSNCANANQCSTFGYCTHTPDYVREQWDILRHQLKDLLEKIDGKTHLTPAEILNSYALFRPIFLNWIRNNQTVIVKRSVDGIKKQLQAKGYLKRLSEDSGQKQNFILFFRDIPKIFLGGKKQNFWKKIREEFVQ